MSFSSVQLLSCVRLFATPSTAACQASLSITNSRSPPKPMSIKSMMTSNHLILCRPFLLLPPIPPSIRVFSNESTLHRRWPKYWSFSNPLNCSTPGFPVHHQLPELAQTHVHWVGDAIQPSHLLSSSSPPAFNLSQRQALFKWLSSLHQMAKELEFQLQHQSFQWTPRTDLL